MLTPKSSDAAENDLEEIVYYLDVNAAAGTSERFIAAFNHTVEWLCEFPGHGAQSDIGTKRWPGLRRYQVKRFRNYMIYYRTEGDTLNIVRVLHGARDRGPILDRP